MRSNSNGALEAHVSGGSNPTRLILVSFFFFFLNMWAMKCESLWHLCSHHPYPRHRTQWSVCCWNHQAFVISGQRCVSTSWGVWKVVVVPRKAHFLVFNTFVAAHPTTAQPTCWSFTYQQHFHLDVCTSVRALTRSFSSYLDVPSVVGSCDCRLTSHLTAHPAQAHGKTNVV